MRVGILTFHRAENFGAVMQAYALQTFLKGQGFDAKIIDYRCPAIESSYHIFSPAILWSRKNVLLSLKTYLNRFRNLSLRQYRKTMFTSFRNDFLDLSPLDGTFDAFITGSDQVWNLHLTGGLDRKYFLDIPQAEKAVKIAYAASSDNDPDALLKKQEKELRRILDSFTGISVREETLREEITQYTSLPVSVCLDPTLIVDPSEYDTLPIHNQDKDYVLAYQMTESESVSRAADIIASSLGCQVVEMHGAYVPMEDRNRHKVGLGPLEMLSYLRNAKAVVTTSFHGIAFSILFRKNFWVIDKGDNARQRSILQALGLSSRLISDPDKCDLSVKIDYNEVEPRLSALIDASRFFLLKMLDVSYMPSN